MKRVAVFVIALALLWALQPEQANAQARRVDRNLRQLDRQASRMINRYDYYPANTWVQIDPWINQYQIQPVRPLARAADRAIQTGLNVADRALFGYNDPNPGQNVWFYDYYTYWPSYYVSGTAATDYSAAIRYYDTDNDGVYETYSNYRDSDRDGRFDEFDRYDFTSIETKDDFDGSPSDAKRHTISGTIDAKRTTSVNKVDFLVVRVKQKDDSMIVVDLGPADRFANVRIEASDSITATGPMERIGEKDVLMADSVIIAEKEIRIERPMPSYTGTVRDVKQIDVNNVKHSMVVVETSAGNQLVDLGPVDALKVTVAPQSKIVVYGVPVKSHDHKVVMASRIDLDGKTHSVVRWK